MTAGIHPFEQLCCPLDQSPLTLEGNAWRCSQGHSFDVAKQGYVNLLPVQNKRSKDPGDSKAMVQARAEFLAQGFYAPIADALATLVLNDDTQALLDAGCGEGYYLRHLLDRAADGERSLHVAALDISKWAVLAAAKQDSRVQWLVASNSHIPLPSASIDTLLCVFGFPVESEFARVLKPDGRLLMVDPGSEHLAELKHVIYEQVHSKPERLPVAADQWRLASEQHLTYTFDLPSHQAIQALLLMTPHLHRASAQGRARAEALQSLSVTVDVWLREFVPASNT
ncbi:putative RNA methyltransferase [Pseudidiomarina salilacus]|uniref:putative RNA methyltransferase n=1 Tax=Pseudidiomarina salilacus TaxID=3384452 RepID=UPI0039852C8C